MLSNRSRYALRAMVHLAGLPGGGPATIAEIAEAAAAPRKFLEAILLDLRRQRLLMSRRGRSGGYALAIPADAISFADVIRALEGPLALTPCLAHRLRPVRDLPGRRNLPAAAGPARRTRRPGLGVRGANASASRRQNFSY